MKIAFAAVAAASFLVSAASADVVYNTSLNPVASRGLGVATTATTPSGTRTTVVGPGGDANRSYGSAPSGTWYQSAVGGGGSVGITTDHPRDSNGSVSFATTSGDSKADLQLNLGQAVLLSSLNQISYDWYRDAASTVTSTLAPVMRLDIAKVTNGTTQFGGSLVFEPVYQTQSAALTNTWVTATATLTSGIIWATNARLGATNAAAIGGQQTFQQWIDGNAGSQLFVTGMSIGVGSGFNDGTPANTGVFSGAVDNVSYSFAGVGRSFNFEVAAATGAVPEPASWAMMIGGFGLVGGALRRRNSRLATA